MVGKSPRGAGRIVFLLAMVFAGVQNALGAPTAYVVAGPSGSEDLYRIDLNTASATLVGRFSRR